MQDRKLPIIRVDSVLIVASLCVAAPLAVFAQDDLSTELRRAA
jgi:hypothetical protein